MQPECRCRKQLSGTLTTTAVLGSYACMRGLCAHVVPCSTRAQSSARAHAWRLPGKSCPSLQGCLVHASQSGPINLFSRLSSRLFSWQARPRVLPTPPGHTVEAQLQQCHRVSDRAGRVYCRRWCEAGEVDPGGFSGWQP